MTVKDDDRDPRRALGRAMKAAGLSIGPRAVGIALWTFADYDTGAGARPSVATLAEVTGTDVRDVHEHLRALEAARIVTATRRPGKPAEYAFTPEALGPAPMGPRPRGGASTHGSSPNTPGGSPQHPWGHTPPKPQNPKNPGDAHATRPPARCAEHLDDPEPPACGRCRDARLRLEAWHRDQPTPTPAPPHCSIHPDQPTGSRACPLCVRDAVPAPNLRDLVHTARTRKEAP